MSKKIIIFISLLALISGLIFFSFFYTKRETSTPTNSQPSETFPLEKKEVGESFRGETSVRENNIEINTDLNNDTKSKEIVIPLKIKDNLSSWVKNQNIELLEETLLLTLENNSNESFFEPWRDFIKNNSSKFLSTLNQNTDEKLLLSTYYIYDWFINLSGEYEKLTHQEKQGISKDFMQIQIYKQ